MKKNEMKKILFMNELFDIYSELLSKTQRDIFIDYYADNLSLSEIAENRNISRSGVYDALKKAENSLLEYEGKLQIHKKINLRNEKIKKLYEDKHLDETALKMLKGE